MMQEAPDINQLWKEHLDGLSTVQTAAQTADIAMLAALRGLRVYHSKKMVTNSPADVDYAVIAELLSALQMVIEAC